MSARPAILHPEALDVVSVQSQVVYGHVGNSAALPTLLAHGLRVAAVPTVMLSNTPHYPSVHGGAIPVDWFEGYLRDLQQRDALTQLRAILVGYVGTTAQMAILERWIRAVQAVRPQVQVIVDPVIGDHDVGVYVAPGMIGAWRNLLLPLAHGLAPNEFELQCLSGRAIAGMDDTLAAARSLLNQRLQWVVVTSAGHARRSPDTMRIAVVTHDDEVVLSHPRIDIAPKGTGDLFSAQLTALLLQGVPLQQAAEQASRHVLAALELTHRAQCSELLLPTTTNKE